MSEFAAALVLIACLVPLWGPFALFAWCALMEAIATRRKGD